MYVYEYMYICMYVCVYAYTYMSVPLDTTVRSHDLRTGNYNHRTIGVRTHGLLSDTSTRNLSNTKQGGSHSTKVHSKYRRVTSDSINSSMIFHGGRGGRDAAGRKQSDFYSFIAGFTPF